MGGRFPDPGTPRWNLEIFYILEFNNILTQCLIVITNNLKICKLTALDEFLDHRGLGADKQEHVIGEADDLLSFSFIQAHTAWVCLV